MSTPLLLTVVSPLAAIAMILLAVRWASRGQQEARLTSSQQAIAAITEAELAFSPADVVVGGDGRSALLIDAESAQLAVVYVVGVCIAARMLSAEDVLQFAWERTDGGADVVSIRLWDVGCPVIRVVFHAHDVAHWRPRLDHLASAQRMAR
ncbi:MAG: hypothetical protein U0132_16575 [Gemmatimonadaceae bacterium]